MRLLFVFALMIAFMTSCSDDCLTCAFADSSGNSVEEEYCGDTNFTDQNGAEISREEFIAQQVSNGFVCK